MIVTHNGYAIKAEVVWVPVELTNYRSYPERTGNISSLELNEETLPSNARVSADRWYSNHHSYYIWWNPPYSKTPALMDKRKIKW